MFTLAYPVLLPEGHGFHDDARAIAPLLEGSLRLTCLDFREGHVQPLIVQGFESAEAAKQFAANFGAALQCASLSLAHGLGAVDSDAAVDFVGHYDGHRPAIYSTTPGASPYFATARATSIDHIIGLAERLNHELQNETARRLAGWPELAVAVRLFSEVEFAGGNTARFVVLLSALEVLVPQARGTKRNRVLSLVRDALLSADRKDRKAVSANPMSFATSANSR